MKKKYEKYNEELGQSNKIFQKQYEPKIKKYCEKYKIGIIQKYQDIVNLLIYQNKENIIDFEKYLKRKKIDVNILENFNKCNEFMSWREKHIYLTEKCNELKDEIRISKLTLITTLFIYLISIFIPIIFNIGFKTYEITKLGTLGFYNSANEISGIISIITPIVFMLFANKKHLIPKIIFSILYLFIILTIGTKTPLLALLITIGMTFIWLLFDYFKNKKYKQILISFLVIIIGIVSLMLVIPKTNFYKNIKVHLDFLKVDNILDILEEEQLIDHFIFSERLTFYTDKSYLYKDSNIYQKLFGIGYINENKTVKLIEMDYYDIYYSHGLIGFIIFMFIPIYVLLKFAFQKRIYDFNMHMINTSLLLVIFLSFFTAPTEIQYFFEI